MIVHNVKIGKETSEYLPIRENKKIYVGSAKSDIRYRDMLVNGRHRWELYSKPSIYFSTFDRKEMELSECLPIVEKKIRGVDGVMIIVSEQTSSDPLVLWEIDFSVANKIPIVGVDIGQNPHDLIPKGLETKITKFGWEWFSEFLTAFRKEQINTQQNAGEFPGLLRGGSEVTGFANQSRAADRLNLSAPYQTFYGGC